MGLSNVLADYNDVWRVLDTAVKHKGGRYELATPGAAVHWRQRAYKYRKLLRTLHAESRVPGTAVETPFDGLVMDLDGRAVVFSWREAKGAFTAPDGTKVTPTADVATAIEVDPLEAAARKLVEERGE